MPRMHLLSLQGRLRNNELQNEFTPSIGNNEKKEGGKGGRKKMPEDFRLHKLQHIRHILHSTYSVKMLLGFIKILNVYDKDHL